MTMSTLFSIISILVGWGLSLTAIALLAQALFPQWVARAEGRVSRMPIRTFLLGLLLGVVLLGMSSALLQTPVQVVGGIMMTATFGLSFAGAAGVARYVGSRLPSPADTQRPWNAIVRGWAVLFLASLTPILGWFFILPVALLMGLGAAVLGIFPARPRPVPSRPVADREAPVEMAESVLERDVAEMPGAAR